jgi:hypothetical protein
MHYSTSPARGAWAPGITGAHRRWPRKTKRTRQSRCGVHRSTSGGGEVARRWWKMVAARAQHESRGERERAWERGETNVVKASAGVALLQGPREGREGSNGW